MKVFKFIILGLLIVLITLLSLVQCGVFNKDNSTEEATTQAQNLLAATYREGEAPQQTDFTTPIIWNNRTYYPIRLKIASQGLSYGTEVRWNFVQVATTELSQNDKLGTAIDKIGRSNFVRVVRSDLKQLDVVVYWLRNEGENPQFFVNTAGVFYIPRVSLLRDVEDMEAYWIYPTSQTFNMSATGMMSYEGANIQGVIIHPNFGGQINTGGVNFTDPAAYYYVEAATTTEHDLLNDNFGIEAVYYNGSAYNEYGTITSGFKYWLPSKGMYQAGYPVRFNVTLPQRYPYLNSLLNNGQLYSDTPPMVISEKKTSTNLSTYQQNITIATPLTNVCHFEGVTAVYSGIYSTVSNLFNLDTFFSTMLNDVASEQYQAGFTAGQGQGYQEGFLDGSNHEDLGVGASALTIFKSVFKIFEIEIMPDFTIGSFITIIVAFALIFLVIKLLRS